MAAYSEEEKKTKIFPKERRVGESSGGGDSPYSGVSLNTHNLFQKKNPISIAF